MHDGFAPGFFASLAIAPEEQLAIIVLTNAGNLYAPKMAGRVAEGVMDVLAGRQPAPTGSEFTRFYLMVNIALLGLTAPVTLSLLRIRRWRQHLLQMRPDEPVSVARHVVLRVIGDLALPFILLCFIPGGAGFPFCSAIKLFRPDVTVWGLAMAVAMLIGGLVRIGIAFSTLRPAAR